MAQLKFLISLSGVIDEEILFCNQKIEDDVLISKMHKK